MPYLCLLVLLTLSVPTNLFSDVNQSSYAGLIVSFQKDTQESSEQSFFTSLGHELTWTEGKTWQSNGEATLNLTLGEDDFSREAALQNTLNYTGRSLTLDFSAQGLVRESDGGLFLSLSDQFDRAQQTTTVTTGGNDQSLFNQDLTLGASLGYQISRYSGFNLSHTRDSSIIADSVMIG